MTVVREYRASDERALRLMHAAQGIDYQFPDLNSPLFAVKKVRETDGRLDGALVLRLCAETMLLLGANGPREKMATMQELQEAVLQDAWAQGLDEIHAAIPNIGFDRRLRQLGWERDRPNFRLWTRSTR